MKINRICVMTAGAFLGALLASCTMPSAVEVQAKPALSLPLNSKSASVSGMLSENLQGAFTDAFGFLDYTSYKDENGSKIQAFLVYYPIIEGQDVDISGQFSGFGDAFSQSQNFNQTIPVPALNDMNIGNVPIMVSMQPLFDSIAGQLNAGMQPRTIPAIAGGPLLEIPIPLTGGGFGLVEFFEGDMVWTFEAGGGSPVLSNMKITIGGKTVDAREGSITLNSGSPKTASFPLAGCTLTSGSGSSFKFNATVSGTGTNVSITPRFADNLKIKKAEGLSIEGSPMPVGSEEIIIASEILPDTFFHTKIGKGKLDLPIKLPDGTGGTSTFKNFTLARDFHIRQVDSPDFDGLGNTWHLRDADFTPNNLERRDLNQNPVFMTTASTVTLKGAGASFTLSDADAQSGNIHITVKPELDIKMLTTVDMDVEMCLVTKEMESSLEGSASFVESIDFDRDKLGLQIIFGKAEIDGLGINIMARDPALFINDDRLQPITRTVPARFTNREEAVVLHTMDGNGKAKKLEFDVTIAPMPNKIKVLETGRKSMELHGVVPGTDKKIEGQVEFVADWNEAVLNQNAGGMNSMFSGQFPKEGEDPISLDMSAMDEYLTGFQFEGIEAYLYMDGPPMFNSLNPAIDMNVHYNGGDKPLCEGEAVTFHPIPKLDPEGTGKYEGTPLKDGEHGIELALEDVINDRPNDMEFAYTLTPRDENGVPKTVITPDMLESDPEVDENGNTLPPKKLSAVLFIVLPLKLRAGPDGGSIPLPEMFEKGKDLFGRSSSGGDSVLDMFKAISLNIELSGALASAGQAGGTLQITNQANQSQEPLVALPLTKKNLKVDLGPGELDIINTTVPYSPDIKLAFPKDSVLELPRGFGLLNIGFSADVNYRIDL